MTHRASSVFFVLSFAAVPWAVEACGRAANVLESGDIIPDAALDSSTASGGITGQPGGAGGSSFGKGGAGTGGFHGPGGSPTGSGGFGGTGGRRSTGGAGGGPSGGAGGAPSGGTGGRWPTGGAGGGPSSGGATADPFAADRRALSNLVCMVPANHRCRVFSFSSGSTVTPSEVVECSEMTQEAQRSQFGSRCWNEWASHVSCAANATAQHCPCADGGSGSCLFDPWTNDFGPACGRTRAALDSCAADNGSTGSATGAYGTYEWQTTEDGCAVRGWAGPEDRILATCVRVSAGFYECGFLVNGVPLVDVVEVERGGIAHVPATSCREVTTEIAGGAGVDALDCCLEYDTGSGSRCDCASELSASVYGGCIGLVNKYAGRFVDFCPQYRSPP